MPLVVQAIGKGLDIVRLHKSAGLVAISVDIPGSVHKDGQRYPPQPLRIA